MEMRTVPRDAGETQNTIRNNIKIVASTRFRAMVATNHIMVKRAEIYMSDYRNISKTYNIREIKQ